MTPARTLLTAALALSFFVPATASAQHHSRGDEREYREIYRIQAAQPVEALRRYQALYDASHAPRALAQIAGVEAQTGRWVEADEHLRAALAQGDDRWIRHNRASLEGMQRTIAQHVCELSISANVLGATLTVNDRPVGTLPLSQPVRVATGTVIVDLTAEGYEPLRQTIQAEAGRVRTDLTMVRRRPPETPAPVLAAPVAPPPAPVAAPASVIPPAPPAPVTPPPSASPMRPLGIASLVLGAVGIGTGIAALVVREGNVERFSAARCGVTDGVVTGGGSCQSEYDAGSSMMSLGIAGFVVGGVFAVTGTALLIAAPRSNERRTAWTCGWGPGTVGVGCGGTF